ncbi:MAG: YihY family inner membrane protein [Campylobacteraceae bacterium]|nr:YihY family inner membrane protein [Campylobacteraceae bacterium]
MFKKLSQIYNLYKKYSSKELVHYAAGLSFYTVLSLIPLLLIMFSLFTQMPSFDEQILKIKNFVFESLLPSHQETISEYIEKFLENSSNLGVVSFVAVIITTLVFFDNYKYIVAKLTNTKLNHFWQDFSKYWTLITLAPFGLGISFYLSTNLQNLLDKTELTSWINFLSILPYLITWAIFGVVYKISINKITSNKFILISSFITSLVWNLSKFAFIKYTFYNKTYLSLYGSFSIILFFFLWIYISWIIFLYGFKIYLFLEESVKEQA